MLKRRSLISMVMRFKESRFELAGARRVVAVVTAVADLVATKAVSTVVRMAICQETALSQRRAAAVAEAKIASTAASLDICPKIARSPKSQESLVVVEVAVGASTAGRTDTCRVNALNQRNLVSQGAHVADLLAKITIELSSASPMMSLSRLNWLCCLTLKINLNSLSMSLLISIITYSSV